MARLRGYDSVLACQTLAEQHPGRGVSQSDRYLPQAYPDLASLLGCAAAGAWAMTTIHPWDIWAPLSADDPALSFPEAVDMISDWHGAAGRGLCGDDAARLPGGALGGLRDQRRASPRALSPTARMTAHPFIMMSFDGNLSSMSTLAHELGHSMHSHYTRAQQPFVYSHYSMFAAEVASNFNQAMVRAHLCSRAKTTAISSWR